MKAPIYLLSLNISLIYRVSGAVIIAILLLGTAAATAQEKSWPRDFMAGQVKVVVFQPQLESFKGDRVEARAAVSLTGKESKEPVFGVVWFASRITTDRDTRMVEFQDVKVEKMKFPNTKPEQNEKLTRVLEGQIAKWPRTMALDRLLAMTEAIEREKVRADRLDNNPPVILFRTTPATLVLLDGKPILRDVEGAQVQRVVNTPFVLFYDPAPSRYYLLGESLWFEASEVLGPWRHVLAAPDAVKAAAAKIAEAELPAGEDTEAEQGESVEVPDIIVATQPTELIVADGEPQFAPLAETNLLYMTNTGRDVFMPVGTNDYYVLLSGRWFKSSSLRDGPWTFVPPDKLPDGFYRIPPGSEKQHVLAFVPGTAEAEDAVADAQIPQTAAIPRDSKITVQYDGKPQFSKVEGTDLQYATNTDKQVLKAGDAYYAVDNAAWYQAGTPQGPYEVATAVPAGVRNIPPSSPVYNVKYVRIYEVTPQVVYMGYTPGYTGTYIYEGTVVYGTGYVYPPYVSPRVYYPAPVTYGYAPSYDPYYGAWNFLAGATLGFVAGAVTSNWWGCGGWRHYGGYYGHGHWDINRNVNINRNINVRRDINWQGQRRPRAELYNNNLYKRPNNWAGRVQEDRRAQLREQYRNRQTRKKPEQRLTSRQNRRAEPRRTGTRREAQTRADRSLRQQTVKKPGPREQRPAGNRRNAQQRTKTREARARERSAVPKNIQRPTTRPSPQRNRTVNRSAADRAAQREMSRNNVYADRNGTVYRKGSQGWQKRDRGGWSQPQSQRQVNAGRGRSSLDRDYNARTRGAKRSQQFQSVQRSAGRAGSGGGRAGRKGGGGRRR